MQLASPSPSSIRGKLGAAACMLLASVTPAVVRADSGAVTQVDATVLLYGEQARAKVTEPTVRVTRIQPSGRSLSGQVTLDVITGASPSGAMPPGVVDSTAVQPPGGESPRVQTMTAASGGGGTSEAPDPGAIPVAHFQDFRAAFDGDWHEPIGGYLSSTLSGHYSREKDYESV